jgi:hypothetical protein
MFMLVRNLTVPTARGKKDVPQVPGVWRRLIP